MADSLRKEKIVIAEDDIYLREELIETFKRKGYPTTGISSFVSPEREVAAEKPDLLVLDINLPGKSGYELCKWFKAHCDFPILILTSRDTLGDELAALGIGADDFLTKPCHPQRLIARVERLLLTYGKVRSVIECGRLFLDTESYKLVVGDSFTILPETEGKILRILMERHPNIVSRGDIFSEVWGGEDFVDENILQVNITRLRKSLSSLGIDPIKTMRGAGYFLECEEKRGKV